MAIATENTSQVIADNGTIHPANRLLFVGTEGMNLAIDPADNIQGMIEQTARGLQGIDVDRPLTIGQKREAAKKLLSAALEQDTGLTIDQLLQLLVIAKNRPERNQGLLVIPMNDDAPALLLDPADSVNDMLEMVSRHYKLSEMSEAAKLLLKADDDQFILAVDKRSQLERRMLREVHA